MQSNENKQECANNSSNKHTAGNYGELLAEKFLQNLGYQIVKKNFRFGHGEIDIVAKDNNVLVFVEVKLRKNLEFGEPAYAVTPAKQKQIKKIAEAYLAINNIVDQDCRIDVIGILLESGKEPRIEHFINAF